MLLWLCHLIHIWAYLLQIIFIFKRFLSKRINLSNGTHWKWPSFKIEKKKNPEPKLSLAKRPHKPTHIWVKNPLSQIIIMFFFLRIRCHWWSSSSPFAFTDIAHTHRNTHAHTHPNTYIVHAIICNFWYYIILLQMAKTCSSLSISLSWPKWNVDLHNDQFFVPVGFTWFSFSCFNFVPLL